MRTVPMPSIVKPKPRSVILFHRSATYPVTAWNDVIKKEDAVITAPAAA